VADQLAEKAEGRLSEMFTRLGQGETLQQIGDGFGITRERVRQLIERDGYDLAEAAGIEIPEALPNLVFSKKVPSEKRCSNCQKITVLGDRAKGMCGNCYHRLRYQGSGEQRAKHAAITRKYHERIDAMAKVEEDKGLEFKFAKKPMPRRSARGKKSIYSPIVEKAFALEAGEHFSVDLPSEAVAKKARSYVAVRLRHRWPATMEEERRDFQAATEGATLFVKRLA